MMLVERLYRAYVRAPDHPFKLRIERWIGASCLPAAGGRFEVVCGVTLRLHPRDWIEYVLIREGRYEPLTLRFVEQNLQPGHTALMAGINFGLHVVGLWRLVHPRCLSTTPSPCTDRGPVKFLDPNHVAAG